MSFVGFRSEKFNYCGICRPIIESSASSEVETDVRTRDIKILLHYCIIVVKRVGQQMVKKKKFGLGL